MGSTSEGKDCLPSITPDLFTRRNRFGPAERGWVTVPDQALWDAVSRLLKKARIASSRRRPWFVRGTCAETTNNRAGCSAISAPSSGFHRITRYGPCGAWRMRRCEDCRGALTP